MAGPTNCKYGCGMTLLFSGGPGNWTRTEAATGVAHDKNRCQSIKKDKTVTIDTGNISHIQVQKTATATATARIPTEKEQRIDQLAQDRTNAIGEGLQAIAALEKGLLSISASITSSNTSLFNPVSGIAAALRAINNTLREIDSKKIEEYENYRPVFRTAAGAVITTENRGDLAGQEELEEDGQGDIDGDIHDEMEGAVVEE